MRETKETGYPSPADAMKSGVGKNSGSSLLTSGSTAPAPCTSNYSRTSNSDTALTAPSSSAGTRLIPRRCGSHQGDYKTKERKESVEDKGKNIGKNTA